MEGLPSTTGIDFGQNPTRAPDATWAGPLYGLAVAARPVAGTWGPMRASHDRFTVRWILGRDSTSDQHCDQGAPGGEGEKCLGTLADVTDVQGKMDRFIARRGAEQFALQNDNRCVDTAT